ncbi:response regulator receiver domain [Candidatus Palauibacter sp.]|uniref:response regulator receiver domain n=1 Tax=Candidatus Palauibacter sp. TaxID=3101350 RepID=UPI003B5AC9F0
MPNNSFQEHCREIARRFLLTAVVVDDELFVTGDLAVRRDLSPPPTSPREPISRIPSPQIDNPPRPLDVASITSSFARHGMICGVVAPPNELNGDSVEGSVRAAARSDIVILDWRLNRKSRQDSFPLLRRILLDDQAHRLRLIAIYTGEPDLADIRAKIAERLADLGESYQPTATPSDDSDAIQVGPCRIVVYGKHGVPTPGLSGTATEDELPDRLIADFGNMVEGLLPSLVLTALGAVRENVYRILERFGSELDPAFLAHRACLPVPQDSQSHIVEQIASELHGVMRDAIRSSRPAGIDAIEHWLTDRFQGSNVVFDLGNRGKREMPTAEVMDMLNHGIEDKPGTLRRRGRDYDALTSGFSGGDENSRELDRRLASAMSFREVIEDGPRQLSIGTVVRMVEAESAKEGALLCVTPACDSVRLTGPSSFLFLPLIDPESKTLQLVVPSAGSGYERMTICMDPARWWAADFIPDTIPGPVVTSPGEDETVPVFVDVEERRYHWVGELKAESAQSVAQAIAERMSRIALNKSEWLRRWERVGRRTS